jgi:lipid A 3-O-deacylase
MGIKQCVATAKLVFLAVFLVMICARPTAAVETVEPSFRVANAPPSVWVDGVGDGFREDTFQAGFALGAGFNIKGVGGKRSHDLAVASANLGWIFSDVMGKNEWYQGNWELAGELFAGAQYSSRERSVGGCTGLIRYNFATGSRWVPFIEGGAGVCGTDIGRPDLSTTFEFNDQTGAGVHYFFRDNRSLTLQYRFVHFSNAGIVEPNHGFNTQLFMVGMNWFF